VYVCICARVRECEVRSAIRCGARCEETIADACGAGTGCGSCLDRIDELIIEETVAAKPSHHARDLLGGLLNGDTLVPSTA
jgi:bacterioferritin-associated ferredoxin